MPTRTPRPRRSFATSGLLAAVAAAALASCVGRIGDVGEGTPGSAGQAQCVGAAPNTEPVVIRMLNRREYENTVRDLLGVMTPVIDDFPADVIVGFDNHAESLVASSDLVEEQLLAAESLAGLADLATLAPCSTSGASQSACADTLIQTFGRRAFRHPLDDGEAKVLRGVYDGALAAGRSFDQALRLVIEAALVAPQFLYRVETTATTTGGVVAVEPFELASRLSYFLWASMPDDELLDAAQNGKLTSRDDITAEVERMIADPKAHEMTQAFHDLWLELYQLDAAMKDTTLYPDFATLEPLFFEETERFADHVFWGDGTTAADYLVSNVAFVNDALAAHYGLPAPGSTALKQVDTSNSERFGLLTQGSILSIFSNPNRTSPTKRGKFVREQLLCQPPPPPPPNVPPLDTSGTSGTTMRERLASHETNPACSGCHTLLDPVGFGLENYDAVGAYRTDEGGTPVDASGNLAQVTPAQAPFVGARALSQEIVATDQFRACVATQWLRFAMGRNEGAKDACTLDQIQTGFKTGERLPDLLVAIALSDAVLFKNTEKAQ